MDARRARLRDSPTCTDVVAPDDDDDGDDEWGAIAGVDGGWKGNRRTLPIECVSAHTARASTSFQRQT